MKKNFTLFSKISLLLLSLTFIFNACTEDKYYFDPDKITQWRVDDFVVRQADWKWESRDRSYYFSFDHSSLTNYVAEKGVVSVAALIDGTFRPLPFTSYFYDEVGKQYLAETVNFEYWAGGIRFNVTALDLFDNTPVSYQPKQYTFKVTLAYP